MASDGMKREKERRLVCAQCSMEGEVSVVYEEGGMTTAMAVTPFYDKDGKRHVHDLNTRTLYLRCSRGHHFTESQRQSCWCGWPTEKSG